MTEAPVIPVNHMLMVAALRNLKTKHIAFALILSDNFEKAKVNSPAVNDMLKRPHERLRQQRQSFLTSK